jgi:hypothetical protein
VKDLNLVLVRPSPMCSSFYLSRIMGTSVAMVDQTYGHLVPDSEEYLRGLLDAFDTADEAAGRVSGV